MSENPFAAPQFADEPAGPVSERSYGGITRLPYFLILVAGSFAAGVVVGVLDDRAGFNDNVSEVAVLAVNMLVCLPRLRNLGYSGWWAMAWLVPVLNLLVALRCLAAPEGYADHGTLDTAGTIIVGLLLFVILLTVMALMAVGGVIDVRSIPG